jgi:hypothetical protein
MKQAKRMYHRFMRPLTQKECRDHLCRRGMQTRKGILCAVNLLKEQTYGRKPS